MKTLRTLVILGALAMSAPAIAQDGSTTGGKFVVGGIVGVDSFRAEESGDTESEEDLLVGVTAGYDVELASGFVIGLEGEYTDSSIGIDYTDVIVAGDRVSLNAGRDLYAGIRAGFRVDPNGLLYVKGGYTNASVEGEYFDGATTSSDEEMIDGFRIGAGGEIDFGGNYAIRLEYRYSDYGNVTLGGFNTGLRADRNQGVVTLLGKF